MNTEERLKRAYGLAQQLYQKFPTWRETLSRVFQRGEFQKTIDALEAIHDLFPLVDASQIGFAMIDAMKACKGKESYLAVQQAISAKSVYYHGHSRLTIDQHNDLLRLKLEFAKAYWDLQHQAPIKIPVTS